MSISPDTLFSKIIYISLSSYSVIRHAVRYLCISYALSLSLTLSSFYFINLTHPSLYLSHRSGVPRGAWTISAASSAEDLETPPCPRRDLADYRRNSPPVKHPLLNISSLSQMKTPHDPLLARRGRLEHSDPGSSPRTCSSERNRVILDEAPLDCPGQQHRRTGCSLSCVGPANCNDFYVAELLKIASVASEPCQISSVITGVISGSLIFHNFS